MAHPQPAPASDRGAFGPAAAGFGFAGFEPGDCPGSGADDFGQQLVAVVDAEGGVGFLDADGPGGVADAYLDLLPGELILPRLLTRTCTSGRTRSTAPGVGRRGARTRETAATPEEIRP